MRILTGVMIVVFMLTAGGCINTTLSLQAENERVPERAVASDCIPIILGLSVGQASVEGALVKATRGFLTPTSIRRVQLHEYMLLGFGARCVEVVGQ